MSEKESGLSMVRRLFLTRLGLGAGVIGASVVGAKVAAASVPAASPAANAPAATRAARGSRRDTTRMSGTTRFPGNIAS